MLSAGPVCSCAHSLCTLHTRPRVQRAPGLPCALCSERAKCSKQNSRETRGEIAKVCLMPFEIAHSSSFRGVRSTSPESITTIGRMDSGPAPSGASRNDGWSVARRPASSRPHQNKNATGCPAAFEIFPTKTKVTYSSSAFLPPIVFSLANTASTLRSSRCFSVGSNSGSFLVVSDAGNSVAPP